MKFLAADDEVVSIWDVPGAGPHSSWRDAKEIPKGYEIIGMYGN